MQVKQKISGHTSEILLHIVHLCVDRPMYLFDWQVSWQGHADTKCSLKAKERQWIVSSGAEERELILTFTATYDYSLELNEKCKWSPIQI